MPDQRQAKTIQRKTTQSQVQVIQRQAKTIAEYTRANILVIPQALFGMKDVRVLRHQKNSAIFYKVLEQDLTDVEFYTSVPCFIWIESGLEVITNSRNEDITLQAGSAVFLPQGINLHSDFVRATSALKAWLVFFDDEVIDDYCLRARPASSPVSRTNVSQSNASQPHVSQPHVSRPHVARTGEHPDADFFVLQQSPVFESFFTSFQSAVDTPEYLRIKLLELLHLIAWQGDADRFYALLTTSARVTPKRNLARLLDRQDVLNLTVNDMARISGRSLSSFNRDFKALYQRSPKQWLQQKRLSYAHQMLTDSECSVTDVALSIGYDNVSNFIRAFKTMYGQTPKQIKRAR